MSCKSAVRLELYTYRLYTQKRTPSSGNRWVAPSNAYVHFTETIAQLGAHTTVLVNRARTKGHCRWKPAGILALKRCTEGRETLRPLLAGKSKILQALGGIEKRLLY